jgi:hypothetical protein
VKSRRWAIAQSVGFNYMAMVKGVVDVGFFVKNLDSGQEYVAHFSGQTDVGWQGLGGASASTLPLVDPNWSEFSTDKPIAPIELDGPNAVYQLVRAGGPPPVSIAGYYVWLSLPRPTTPRPIQLHGHELTAGTAMHEGFLAKGTFTVLGPKN